MAILVHSADIQNYDGAQILLTKARSERPRLQWIWADSIYQHIVDWTFRQFGWLLKIVTRDPGTIGFQVQPRRWVVERTFGWIGRFRRHSKDNETKPKNLEAHIKIATTHVMLQRITRNRLSL